MQLTVKIGDADGIILPRSVLDRLNVVSGDSVYVTDVPDGVKISTRDANFDEVMKHAERVMRENDNALRRLAE
jgi:putative addiction module antidote